MAYTPKPSADVVAYVIADLAIILIATRIVGELFERVGQPRIVGEIIAGILIGPTILGGTLNTPANPAKHLPALAGTGLVHKLYPLEAFSFLNGLGSVALILYMMLVGLELDQTLLKGKATKMVVVAVAVVAVPVALGFLCGALLTGSVWRPPGVSSFTFSLFLGAGLAVTAFPVMARILQEKGLLASQLGAIGVGSAAIVTVLMFLVISAAAASASHAGIVTNVGERFGWLAALVLVLAVVGRPLLSWVTRNWREGDTPSGNLIGLLLAGSLACGLATDRILGAGLVGGFLFGLAVPARPGLVKGVVERLESAVLLFFLPVFLAVSGLRTNLTLFTGKLVAGTVLFLVLMVVGKWAAGYVAGRATGLADREAHAIGVLLNCRGLLILVVALIGLQLNVITPQTQLVFVLGAIVTTIMTGPLVNVFLTEQQRTQSMVGITMADLEAGRRRESVIATFDA